MSELRWRYSEHAIDRMVEWDFSADEVESVIDGGETIEEYANGSRLVLGRAGARPVHVVVYEDEPAEVRIVVTAYEPTDDRWAPGFRERKKNP